MCDCLDRKCKEIIANAYREKGNYMILLTGELTLYKGDELNTKSMKHDYSAVTFGMDYCPWCGQKMMPRQDGENTTNRIFFKVE